MVRGHLKGADGTVFPLRHITTIGQGNSDSVIKVIFARTFHLLIEERFNTPIVLSMALHLVICIVIFFKYNISQIQQ